MSLTAPKLTSLVVASVVGLFLTGTEAMAQLGGGYGQSLRNQLHARSVGTGFSVDSINQQSMASARGNQNLWQLGSSTTQTMSSLGTSPSRSATFGAGVTSGTGEKPFSNVSTTPTVSPYLNLFRQDLSGFSDLNYQTLVRPQLQQQDFNQSMQRQAQALDRRVNSIAAQSAFNPQGSRQQMPTGHTTVFFNLSHYYPSAQRARR